MSFNLKDTLETLETKRKFWQNNRDIFLRCFTDLEQYNALIEAGNFKKMEEMVKGSRFDISKFEKELQWW